MHAGHAGGDHLLHLLDRRIGHDGREVVDVLLAFGPLGLVGVLQGAVDALYRHRRRHRLARHLPARQVDGLQAGLDLLHGLHAGQRAQRIDERLFIQQAPQLVGAALRQRVFDPEGAAQAHHLGRSVSTGDAHPARIGVPVFLQFSDLLLARCQ
jgi:hypothetical protein